MDLIKKINHAHEMSMANFTGDHEDFPTHVLLRPEDIEKCNNTFQYWYPIGMQGTLAKGFIDHEKGWDIIKINPIKRLTQSQTDIAKEKGWQHIIWN